MNRFIVLLRAIGPATHAKMSMRAWHEAALAKGYARADTFGATGNMIVESGQSADTVLKEMTQLVTGFGLGPNNLPFVRTPADLDRILHANPLPEATTVRPSQVLACFFGEIPDFSWISAHQGTETLAPLGDVLIADFAESVSQSRLTPAQIEKRSGTVMTFRNWNTITAPAARCR